MGLKHKKELYKPKQDFIIISQWRGHLWPPNLQWCILFYTGYMWLYFMMTSSNGNIFRVTGPLCGEFTGPGEFPTQRPVTRSFDVFFDRRLNKRLSKQPRGWWLETLSWSLWRQSNVADYYSMFQQASTIYKTTAWGYDLKSNKTTYIWHLPGCIYTDSFIHSMR